MKLIKKYPFGPYIFQFERYHDHRGYFNEIIRNNKIQIIDKVINFKQDNLSKSKKNVFRGFHYQMKPKAQAKLIFVLNGKIDDYFFHLNKKSKYYKKVFKITLDSKDNKCIYLPDDCAHGFHSLEKDTIVYYKCTNLYSKKNERSISLYDITLKLETSLLKKNLIISKKDLLINE